MSLDGDTFALYATQRTMRALSRRVVVTSRSGRRIFGSQADDLPEKRGGVGGPQRGPGVASSCLPGQPRQRRGGGGGVGVPVAGPARLLPRFLDRAAGPGAGGCRG